MDPGIIAAGGSLLETAIGGTFQGFQNRAQRRWASREQEKQFTRNLQFWRMQNQYNSPESVMQRNKQAGLNPHFGLLGNQPTAASPIAPVDVAEGQFESPNTSGIGRAASQYANRLLLQRQDLENKGIAIQNEIATQDLWRKQFETQIRGIDFANYERQKGYQLDAAQADVNLKRANTEYTLNQKELNSVRNQSDLLVAASQIALQRAQTGVAGATVDQVRQQTELLRKEGKLKDIEMRMRDLGVQPGSQTWVYMLGTIVRHLLESK